MKMANRVFSLFMIAWVATAQSAPAQQDAGAPERLRISGLKDSVEILEDRWGISHIYAKNESDLFFAQGYNVARDRLFQHELWRRQATGVVAEILVDRGGERIREHKSGLAPLKNVCHRGKRRSMEINCAIGLPHGVSGFFGIANCGAFCKGGQDRAR